MMPDPIPPIRRSISVSWNQTAAFERFTSQFDSWWPATTHSVGGERLERIVFECRPGGMIYEEHKDGRRFGWGQVLEWEPPTRVKFTWYPSREPSTAQEVEIQFVSEANGTHVELISTGWENWGTNARRARRAYDVGWGYVLNVFAGRRTARMSMLDGVMNLLDFIQKFRGGRDAIIKQAKGEIPAIRATATENDRLEKTAVGTRAG